MKDHEIRELVNELTKVARVYHRAGCLRAIVSRTVKEALKNAEANHQLVLSTADQKPGANSDVD